MNKKSVIVLGLSVFAIAMLVYANVPIAAGAQPGDANDPLVTRRYVDNRINELAAQIARLEAMITGQQVVPQAPAVTPPGGNVPPADNQPPETLQPDDDDEFLESAGVISFSAYYVPQGRRLYFDAGAWFILRTGDVRAVTGVNGLIDLTAGRDVIDGETVNRNHLFFVPVADGRGVQFHTSGWIMIIGGYQVAN